MIIKESEGRFTMQIQTSLSNKGPGFYLSMIASVLSFILAVIYQYSYHTNPYYASSVFILLLLALPCALVLFFINLDGFIPAATTLLVGLAILQFIHAMYFDVSVVLVGIDKNSFDPEFILCSVLFGVCFLLGEVSIYTRVRK